MPSITQDTWERDPENWTVSPIKTLQDQMQDGLEKEWTSAWKGLEYQTSSYIPLASHTALLWKMFMAGAAGGIYINKLPSHKPVVGLGNTTLSRLCEVK